MRTHLITKCWKVANSVQTLARRFMLRRSAVSASSKRLSHNTNTKLTVEKSAKFWADASYPTTEISAGTTRKSACYRAIQTHKYNVEREQEQGEHARTNWYKDKQRQKRREAVWNSVDCNTHLSSIRAWASTYESAALDLMILLVKDTDTISASAVISWMFISNKPDKLHPILIPQH